MFDRSEYYKRARERIDAVCGDDWNNNRSKLYIAAALAAETRRVDALEDRLGVEKLASDKATAFVTQFSKELARELARALIDEKSKSGASLRGLL